MVIVAVDGDGDERRKKMVTSERRDKLKGEMGKGLIMSMDGHMPTQSYQEGTSKPSLRHVNETLGSLQQSIKGLARQYQSVARDVKDLKRKEEANYEQNLMSIILMIAMRAIDLELEIVYNGISCKGVPRNYVRNGGNYVNIDKSYNYGGYNCRRKSSPTLGTTSSPLSYNNLRLPLFCGTFCPYDYEAWEKKVESLFYSYCFSFKELKLFLELYASYVTLVGNVMVNPFTCDLAFDIDHMLKCSFPCTYLEKQLLVSIARFKPSYHDLELLHDNIFFDLLVHLCGVRFISSFGSFVESGYDERASWFPWSLYKDFYAKFKGELVEHCDYE
ncbi:hypothetical protein M9H77_11825 [Catharanthus roseus]|uniref:Uncharacterized protein n=1 Tax=Catharanthus roseus TaxID=4058 RepID=A0ACC0BFM0_CATRO|nr:hypothetical protein M9H77_11825 [Catharanthus roseus]